ncbi:MAG: hypothetical protein ABW026_18615 [Microvirga sp.]
MFLKASAATLALFVAGLTLGFSANWFSLSSQTYDFVWADGGTGKLDVVGMTQDACRKMLTVQAEEASCRKQTFLRYVAGSF